MNFIQTTIGRLRLMSMLDALSFLYLLYCAIYLKRICGDAEAIRIPGMVHGVLFCIYLIGLTSLVPFLPFWLDTWLAKQEKKSGDVS